MSGHLDHTADISATVFRRAPLLGWTVTTDEGDALHIPLVFWRDGRPIDWQGGRKLVADEVPGSGRVLVQDMGALPLTLTTNALLQDRATFQRLWRYQERQGTLTMNLAWTMHVPDREEHLGSVDYAHFDNVTLLAIGAMTFDMARRPLLEGITFQREDATW